jgi:hypothetical protein
LAGKVQTDLNNLHENEKHIDYDYKVGDKILVWKNGILRKTESRWHKVLEWGPSHKSGPLPLKKWARFCTQNKATMVYHPPLPSS